MLLLIEVSENTNSKIYAKFSLQVNKRIRLETNISKCEQQIIS